MLVVRMLLTVIVAGSSFFAMAEEVCVQDADMGNLSLHFDSFEGLVSGDRTTILVLDGRDQVANADSFATTFSSNTRSKTITIGSRITKANVSTRAAGISINLGSGIKFGEATLTTVNGHRTMRIEADGKEFTCMSVGI